MKKQDLIKKEKKILKKTVKQAIAAAKLIPGVKNLFKFTVQENEFTFKVNFGDEYNFEFYMSDINGGNIVDFTNQAKMFIFVVENRIKNIYRQKIDQMIIDLKNDNFKEDLIIQLNYEGFRNKERLSKFISVNQIQFNQLATEEQKQQAKEILK